MTAPLEVRIPRETVMDDFVTIVRIALSSMSPIRKGEVLLEAESSKTSFVIAAERDGFVEYCVSADEEVPVGTCVARIWDSPSADSKEHLAPPPSQGASSESKGAAISEKARKMMEDAGLKAEDFRGTSFVTVADVKLLMASRMHSGRSIASLSLDSRQENEGKGSIVRRPLSSAKKTENARLSMGQASLTSTVHVFLEGPPVAERDIPAVSYLSGSLLPVAVFESSRVLRNFPEFNASYYVGHGLVDTIRQEAAYRTDFSWKYRLTIRG